MQVMSVWRRAMRLRLRLRRVHTSSNTAMRFRLIRHYSEELIRAPKPLCTARSGLPSFRMQTKTRSLLESLRVGGILSNCDRDGRIRGAGAWLFLPFSLGPAQERQCVMDMATTETGGGQGEVCTFFLKEFRQSFFIDIGIFRKEAHYKSQHIECVDKSVETTVGRNNRRTQNIFCVKCVEDRRECVFQFDRHRSTPHRNRAIQTTRMNCIQRFAKSRQNEIIQCVGFHIHTTFRA